jgi:hypothetical protein
VFYPRYHFDASAVVVFDRRWGQSRSYEQVTDSPATAVYKTLTLDSKRSEGNTALHQAALSGNEMLLDALMMAGADVNHRNKYDACQSVYET